MISDKKDCIGKTMAARPGLMEPTRQRLVGFRPLRAGAVLTAGAHVFERGKTATRVNDQGYLTSVAPSPTLGHWIGLGFVERGPERYGEVVRMVDAMRGLDEPVEICAPVFFDEAGDRARG
jgi:sarcosine oxidase subunit alpha